MVVEGQLHGGLAQGIGQALLGRRSMTRRQVSCSPGRFMDYCLPAPTICRTSSWRRPGYSDGEQPALGMKGAAEVGCIGAAAVINAVIDALDGIEIDMPATPETVWRALNRRTEP